MQTVQRAPEHFPVTLQRREPSDAEVRGALKVILQSQPFRTSRQCQDLLTYIVEHSLHGEDGSLRERILGIEVFGRATDYDTSEDPVVRMRAADVRKRLAQFYQAVEHDPDMVVFDLKPGSYRATFHYQSEAKEDPAAKAEPEAVSPVETPRQPAIVHTVGPTVVESLPMSQQGRFGVRAAVFSALLLVLLAIVGWRLTVAHSVTLQQRFWAPLTRSGQPILIYVGSNAVYRFTPEYLNRYKKEHDIKANGPEFFVDLPKGGVVQADDLIAVKDCFVSVADLAAATGVVAMLKGWQRPFNLRSAADMTISDIRNTPSVLIGGFNDTWTLETTNDLPYAFRDGIRIVSRDVPARSWTVTAGETKTATDRTGPNAGPTASGEDYALITRLQNSNTGGPVLSIGGIGSFGTQAAAEFVTSPEKMNDLLKTAPAGWDGKNMQAVLRIKVVGFAPVAVDVVATTYW